MDELKQFLAVFEEKQRGLESSFREFKAELKTETAKMESAAKDMANSVHNLDKNLEVVKAQQLPEKTQKLEDRVDSLEKWQAWLKGAIAVLGTVVTILITIIIKKLF